MSISAVTSGTVITPGGLARADVLIDRGTIAAIGDHGDPGGQRLDASGCYVLPGGVDPHCHLMPGVHPATAAAARGGTTTVLSFTGPAGETDLAALLRNRAELERDGAVTDIGLHAAIYDPEHIAYDELAAVKRAGAAAIKIFLAYPELGIMCSTRRLYELMRAARELGLLVQVHCENAPLIEALVEESLHAEARQAGPRPAGAPAGGAGATGVGAAGVGATGVGAGGAAGGGADGEVAHPGARIFADTRPREVEEEAVARTLAAASLAGAACYLVHLSSAGSVEQVRLARRRGQRGVFAEVCTHHLLLDDTRYARADAERYLVCPPLRDRGDVEALWEGLADGTIDTVGSDHCQVKSATSGPLAEAGRCYSYGLAGVGPRLPLLLSAAAARGLPIELVARVAAENPARAFGHYPAKGALAPGSDADIVIFDPNEEQTISAATHHMNVDYSAYEGMKVKGTTKTVLSRGRVVIDDGKFVGKPGDGQFLRRSTFSGRY